jgi:hypothetical protein
MWCGGNHLHKDCPDKENTSSTPTCCNCQLAERETAHPSNYRGCRHAKEEMQKTEVQKNTQDYDWKDVLFKIYDTNHVFHNGSSRQLGTKEATTSTTGEKSVGQSVRDPNVNSLPSDDILGASIVVQQIMTEFKNTESEQSRVMAITKIVLYLTNQKDY